MESTWRRTATRTTVEAHRVKKASGNLLMVYDIGGKLIAEFDSSTGALKKEYVYGPGGLLAIIEPGTNGTNIRRRIILANRE